MGLPEAAGNLIQWALVGAVIGNKWWVSLKYRIRDFAIKYSQQLALYRAKKAKSLEDRLSRAVEVGDSVAIDLAKGNLEREASDCYKGFVVRNRQKSVPNEAVKCSELMRKEELRRFPSHISVFHVHFPFRTDALSRLFFYPI